MTIQRKIGILAELFHGVPVLEAAQLLAAAVEQVKAEYEYTANEELDARGYHGPGIEQALDQVADAVDRFQVAVEGGDAAPTVNPEACPGCGCRPGDGRTAGCTHPVGCGYWQAISATAAGSL